jgi:hypothetical protein
MYMKEKAKVLGAFDCGFVEYLGGHKAKNPKRKPWCNRHKKEMVFNRELE